MDTRNLKWATILAILMAISNTATVLLGRDHLVSQVLEVAANAGCQIVQDIEKSED